MAKNRYAQLLNQAKKQASTRYAEIRSQIDLDAAVIAANEVLGMGEGRAKKFVQAMVDTANEIQALILTDSKDDATLTYTKEVMDRRIKQIVGEKNFNPWDVRYGSAIYRSEIIDVKGALK